MVPKSVTNLDLIQARVSEIPTGWELRKVKEALNIRNNLRKPISQEVRDTIKGQYPYYGPTKVQGYISEYEQDGTYALIGEDGDHFLKYGIMAQTQFISGKCTVNNHAHILESSDTCDSEWFFNYFKHRDITNFLSRQGSGRFKLNKATLEKLPILVPPLQEQRKIARILTTWGNAISTTEKLIVNSKQQKKALMQQLLTGKKRLVNSETEKVFEGEWEEFKFDEIVTSTQLGTTERAPNSEDKNTVPLLKMGNLSWGGINCDKLEYLPRSQLDQSLLLRKGDFLFNTRNTPELVGKSAVWKDEVATATFDNNINRITFNLSMDPYYLCYYLTFGKGKSTINSLPAGSTSVAAIYWKDLKNIRLVLPGLMEQKTITSVLATADKEIELLEEKLAHLKQEKKALMQQLLTGKRRVKIAA
ncbi:restriction endonuclease subunit S [Aliivibrio fischeri]|uniref:restriction endonuclease subunit S n=1 Tax=Aliivibrio fischeri TaxID=668 RepID=UPI0012D8A9F9|nr:restriction endonuclease subunit S [Aliivibrio fischeri]MUI55163.1 restriction endonuclease subunit S [Aliivibrio fischeri]